MRRSRVGFVEGNFESEVFEIGSGLNILGSASALIFVVLVLIA